NFVPAGGGVAARYDKVRVALGLAHMADDMKKYAARATCPVAILRGTHSSELTLEQAKEIAGCWKNAVVIDVEGDYALQMENTAGPIKAKADPTTPAPEITFDKKTTLELGGRSVDLYPADLSPTDDYIVVHYPAGRLAMFVDLVQPRNIPFRTLLGHPERIVE